MRIKKDKDELFNRILQEAVIESNREKITLLDLYAGMAMVALIIKRDGHIAEEDKISTAAFEQAKSMIKKRKVTTGSL